MSDQGARLRSDAEAIYHAALRRVDPAELVRERLRRQGSRLALLDRGLAVVASASRPEHVYVVAVGKAALGMAAAAAEVVGDSLTQAIAIVPAGGERPLPRVAVFGAGHPLPDEAGRSATARAMKLLEAAGRNDLAIVLVSGGASALFVEPAPPLALEDKRALAQLLLQADVPIGEVNTVRKHCSRVKGGLAAVRAAPAALWGLALSDVPGDDLATIGSGPTVADSSTYAEAWRMLDNRRLLAMVPPAVRERLERGRAGKLPETPKPGDPRLAGVSNVVLAGVREALCGGAEEARRRGYSVVVREHALTGETEGVAAAFARDVLREAAGRSKPLCVLAGGETTVRVGAGAGRGGRNQHFALAAALGLAGTPVVLLSAGSDGIDGPTDAAGAFVDGTTLGRASARGLDACTALAHRDSYGFFAALGDLYKPGPTGTNVMDIKVALLPGGAHLPRSPGL